MKTDRELLELAAKAAGIEGEWGDKYGFAGCDDVVDCTDLYFLPNDGDVWDPLGDDGDALRLAVQCGLEVSFVDEDSEVRACVGYPNPVRISYVFEDHSGDIFAATRRAIVRAAASIGESGADQ